MGASLHVTVTFLAADVPTALVAVTEMVPVQSPPVAVLAPQTTEPFDFTETFSVPELDAQVHVDPQLEACNMALVAG
jgi:hypothetical protein